MAAMSGEAQPQADEALSNADVDIDVTSSTMILGAHGGCSADEANAEDASMLVDVATPVDMRHTNVTTVPKEPSTCWKTGARYCIVTFCCLNVVMLLFGGLWPALSQYSKDDHKRIVIIQTDRLVNIVSEKFLSVALDSSIIQKKFSKFDTKSKAARMMGSSLSPCYLRVGGIAADRLIFVEGKSEESKDTVFMPMDGGSCAYEGELCSRNHRNFNMTGDQFVELNTYAKTAGMELIFDLNALLRNGKQWDDSNARQLLEFANAHNFKISWQLGNEPNAYWHQFEQRIEATQLGDDFFRLRQLLDTYPRYSKSLLLGPDITGPRLPQLADLEYLREFLRVAGAKARLDAVTWHQYYLNGREAVLQDFLNVDTFNALYEQINLVKSAVRSMALNTPIWLGETGSAFGGGSPEISDRFLASFLWLDKLGVAASEGIHVVIRQSLFGGNYGLIRPDHKGSLVPNPDFWVSLLYKKLVGTGVVGVSLMKDNKGPVRIYCHCTEPSALHPGLGGVTIFGVNLLPDAIELSLQGTHNVSSVDRYILQGETGLQSQFVLLNGEKLEIGGENRLPPLAAQPMDLNSPISMPEHSMGFWVLHGAQVPACQNSQ